MKASYGYGEQYAREALHQADRALALNANLADALKARGQALQWLGREEEALDYSRRAIEANPHFALAINNAGEQLAELGRFDQALPYQLLLIRNYWRELTF